jgi:hypothetical protein
MNLDKQRELVLEKNPVAFRTGIQGIEGNFWFYEAHIKGASFKFRVDTDIRPKETLDKKMNSVDLLDYLVEF